MNYRLEIHSQPSFRIVEISDGCYVRIWNALSKVEVGVLKDHHFSLGWVETDLKPDKVSVDTFLKYGMRVDKSEEVLLVDQFDEYSNAILYYHNGCYFRLFKEGSSEIEYAKVDEESTTLNWSVIPHSNRKAEPISKEAYHRLELMGHLPNMIVGRSYKVWENDNKVFRKWSGSDSAEMLVDDDWVFVNEDLSTIEPQAG